jgi:hypothetical protein
METDEDKVFQLHVVRTITNFITKSISALFVVNRLACVGLRRSQNDIFTTKIAIEATLMKCWTHFAILFAKLAFVI